MELLESRNRLGRIRARVARPQTFRSVHARRAVQAAGDDIEHLHFQGSHESSVLCKGPYERSDTAADADLDSSIRRHVLYRERHGQVHLVSPRGREGERQTGDPGRIAESNVRPAIPGCRATRRLWVGYLY